MNSMVMFISFGSALIALIYLWVLIKKSFNDKLSNKKTFDLATSVDKDIQIFNKQFLVSVGVVTMCSLVVLLYLAGYKIALSFLFGAFFSSFALFIIIKFLGKSIFLAMESSKKGVIALGNKIFKTNLLISSSLFGSLVLGLSLTYSMFNNFNTIIAFAFGSFVSVLFLKIISNAFSKKDSFLKDTDIAVLSLKEIITQKVTSLFYFLFVFALFTGAFNYLSDKLFSSYANTSYLPLLVGSSLIVATIIANLSTRISKKTKSVKKAVLIGSIVYLLISLGSIAGSFYWIFNGYDINIVYLILTILVVVALIFLSLNFLFASNFILLFIQQNNQLLQGLPADSQKHLESSICYSKEISIITKSSDYIVQILVFLFAVGLLVERFFELSNLSFDVSLIKNYYLIGGVVLGLILSYLLLIMLKKIQSQEIVQKNQHQNEIAVFVNESIKGMFIPLIGVIVIFAISVFYFDSILILSASITMLLIAISTIWLMPILLDVVTVSAISVFLLFPEIIYFHAGSLTKIILGSILFLSIVAWLLFSGPKIKFNKPKISTKFKIKTPKILKRKNEKTIK